MKRTVLSLISFLTLIPALHGSAFSLLFGAVRIEKRFLREHTVMRREGSPQAPIIRIETTLDSVSETSADDTLIISRICNLHPFWQSETEYRTDDDGISVRTYALRKIFYIPVVTQPAR